MTLREIIVNSIEQALLRNNYNSVKAAKELGVAHRTIYGYKQKYNIQVPKEYRNHKYSIKDAEFIMQIIKKHNYIMSLAAKELGIAQSTICGYKKRFNLPIPSYNYINTEVTNETTVTTNTTSIN